MLFQVQFYDVIHLSVYSEGGRIAEPLERSGPCRAETYGYEYSLTSCTLLQREEGSGHAAADKLPPKGHTSIKLCSQIHWSKHISAMATSGWLQCDRTLPLSLQGCGLQDQVRTTNIGCKSSLVQLSNMSTLLHMVGAQPRPSQPQPSFHRFQYGKATESWAGDQSKSV